MATLILEDGSFTVGLPTAAAFLMRTSMSAMGSVMLMKGSLSAPISAFAKSGLSREGPGPLKRCRQAGQAWNHSRKPARVGPASVSVAAGAALPFLPAGLAQARHVATHGGFAQHVAAQAELAVHAARAARQFAAVALAARRGVTRKLGELGHRLHLLLVGGALGGDDLLQLVALAGVLLGQLRALRVTVDHGGLCHVSI